MTITEKILAAHCGKNHLRPGEFVFANVDLIVANDITAPIAIKEFEKAGIQKVFDPERVVLVPDHFTPNKDIKSAEQARIMRLFARRQQISHYFEVGRLGIEHSLLPETGLVGPGDLVVGADSHTCTYGALGAFSTGVGSTDFAAAMALGKVWLRVPKSIKFIYTGRLQPWVSGKDLILFTIGKIGVQGALYRAMEFTGEVIENLPMEGRLTMCNMAIEAGAKSGIVPPDDITKNYIQNRVKRGVRFFASDPDASYEAVHTFDVSSLEPQVALPNLPENVRAVSEVKGTPIDQVVIGSCTNGWLSDLRVAGGILKGKKVSERVRLIVIPATQAIYLEALREGLIEIFIQAGAAVSTPTCGPCLGGHMGVLAEGERALATTNRNFVGRMGHPRSEVYLCSPAVAAASAVSGFITAPGEAGEGL